MKEIGIEKFIMLLDIYEEEVVGVHSVGEHITEKDEAWIISKKFGFIKWLVENDKIDRTDIPTGFDYEYQGRKNIYCVSYEVNILTMRLSISYTPIEDLISYIK